MRHVCGYISSSRRASFSRIAQPVFSRLTPAGSLSYTPLRASNRAHSHYPRPFLGYRSRLVRVSIGRVGDDARRTRETCPIQAGAHSNFRWATSLRHLSRRGNQEKIGEEERSPSHCQHRSLLFAALRTECLSVSIHRLRESGVAATHTR